MEKGGAGQELLNLIQTGQALRGEPVGEYRGAPWSDAYIYNTVEAACLALEVDPDGDATLAAAQAALRATIEKWIPIIQAAQGKDGYIHSFHTLKKRPRFTAIGDHEFYVMGYLMEMGIAHYRMTGGKDPADSTAWPPAARISCAKPLARPPNGHGRTATREWNTPCVASACS